MLLALFFKLAPSLLKESEVGVCHRVRAARKQTSVECERYTVTFTHALFIVCLQCQPLQLLIRHKACTSLDNSDHCEATVCIGVSFHI